MTIFAPQNAGAQNAQYDVNDYMWHMLHNDHFSPFLVTLINLDTKYLILPHEYYSTVSPSDLGLKQPEGKRKKETGPQNPA